MKAIVGSTLSAMALAAGVAPALAQDGYPTKPLRLIVPFPSGGGNDILARTVSQRLGEVVGQQIVVDNRGGAGGLIGTVTAAQSAPDGYTLFLGSVGNLAHNPALQKNLPYDPVRDFAPVTLLATSPVIVAVNPGVAAQNIRELIALAKAKPGALNYASAGPGSSLHMTAELFKHATGTNMVHIAYKGASPAFTDLIAGQVQVIFSTMPPALPHVKSGRLRALGTTGLKRAAAVPDVPTVAESGVPGFEVLNWQGIVVQRRTPPAIVARLHRDVVATMKASGMQESVAAQGLDAATGTPDQFGALIKSEIKRYTELVKTAGIRVD
jgi:tripartite-type tricarboxylate transporter receptor subunit TctC